MDAPSLGPQTSSLPDLQTFPILSDGGTGDAGIDWMSYFPFVTAHTSSLAGILLDEHQEELWANISWPDDPTIQLQRFFQPPDNFNDTPEFTFT